MREETVPPWARTGPRENLNNSRVLTKPFVNRDDFPALCWDHHRNRDHIRAEVAAQVPDEYPAAKATVMALTQSMHP